MKKMIWVLAATLICGACVFTSCKKDKDNTDLNLKEKIIGKWMTADIDGRPALTNEKSVTTFVSATKAYGSTAKTDFSPTVPRWNFNLEFDVQINGNKMTLTGHPYDDITLVNEYTVTAINDTEMFATFKHTTIRNGEAIIVTEQAVRFVKVAVDYRQAILGTWEGHCTSEGSVFDDGQEHRWEYKADGTYTYYVMDGDNWVPYEGNTLNEYFVDGKLLCTRWVDNGVENREWWEISINGNRMNWTALRKNDDGTTFTATFEMEKVN